jgi:hypothetical protein
VEEFTNIAVRGNFYKTLGERQMIMQLLTTCMWKRSRKFPLACAMLLIFFALSTLTPSAGWVDKALAATPITYYVDCASGNDANSGTGPGQAWRTIDKANKAPLQPGDKLLFKRGCAWVKTLNVVWNGTGSLPITIGAYGEGELPIFKNGTNDNIKITGSYLILEYLHAQSDPRQVDPNCANQPYGYYQTGFQFVQGSAFNTLRYSKASGNTAGVRIGFEAHHIKVLNNTLVNNNVLQILDAAPNNDLGAWGVVVHGNDNEFAYNYFSHNNAWCSYDFGISGNSIEIYAGQRNSIHHNTSIDDETFSELGSQADRRAADNIYAYNLVISSVSKARFIIVRGPNELPWGPTLRTTVVNNTVYYTAPNSAGVVCGGGCSSDILTLRNNILWAEEKAIYASHPFKEENNLYWSSDGTPYVQFPGFKMHVKSKIAAPQFVDRANRNLHLQPASPAVNAGAANAWQKDLDGKPVPSSGGYDIGAYEFVSQTSAANILNLPMTAGSAMSPAYP